MEVKKETKSLHDFLYGINSTIKKSDRHYPLGKEIGGVFKIITNWNLDKIKTSQYNKTSTLPEYISLNYNTNHTTIAPQIESGKLTIRTIDSIVCYFFFELGTDLNSNTKIPKLEQLKWFFSWLFTNGIKQKNIQEIEVLINHLLKQVALDFSAELKNNWELDFFRLENGRRKKLFENNIKSKDVIKHKEIPSLNKNIDLNESISKYKTSLLEKYESIKLRIIDIEIPVDSIIKLPLKKEITENKNLLSDESKEPKKTIEYEIINLISKKNDLFIHASAGYGKSTLLQWLTYKIANNDFIFNQNKIPIFIELKSYDNTSNQNGLLQLIKKSITCFPIAEIENTNYNIILLIDGFDEFKGDSSQLLDQIKAFKKDTNAQIIFTGRTIPKFKNKGLEFNTYLLTQFKSKNVKNLFDTVLVNKEELYFEDLCDEETLEHLKTPLYLMLFLFYIKERVSNKSDISDIKRVVHNKGLFLETILIKEFILKYEEERLESQDYWKINKQIQMEIISYIGYYLTINQQDVESIDRIELEKEVFNHLKKEYIQENIQPRDLINNFLHHNILEQVDFKIRFEKKELRLFFAARYVSKNIKTLHEFQDLKRSFKGDDEKSWNTFERYFFGLINPNILYDASKLRFIKGRILLNNDVEKQIELLCKLVHQKNYPKEIKNIDFLKDAIITLLIDFNEVTIKKGKKTGVSTDTINNPFISKLNISEDHISLTKIKNGNYNYLAYKGMMGEESGYYKLLNFLLSYDLGMSIFELIELLEILNDPFYSSDSLKKAIGEESNFKITRKEKFKLISLYSFGGLKIYNSFYTEYLFRGFIKAYVESNNQQGHSNEFIEVFYKKHPEPSHIKYMRLYYFLAKNGWGLIKIDSNLLDPLTRDKIFNTLVSVSIYLKNTHINLELFIIKFLKNNIDNTFYKFFLKEVFTIFKKHTNSFTVRLNACKTIINLDEEKYIEKFYSIIKNDKDLIIKDVIISAISTSKGFIYYNGKSLTWDSFPNLYLEIIHSKYTSPELIKKMLSIAKLTSKELTNEVLNLAGKDPQYSSDAIDFFGRHSIKKEIPFLIEQLHNDEFALKAFHNLFFIDREYYSSIKAEFHKKYFLYCFARLSVLQTLNNRNYLHQIDVFNDALYIGDQEMLEEYLKIDRNKVAKEAMYEYLYNLEELERKISILEKEKSS